MDFVNEKIIEGKTYTAYRDAIDPHITYIVCEGVKVETNLTVVWNDDAKIIELFYVS